MSEHRRSESGAVLVEFIISALVFFSLCFLSCDLLRLAFQSVTAQYVANEAVRTIVVGRQADVKETVRLTAEKWGINLNPATQIKVCSLEQTYYSGQPCDFSSAGQQGSGRDLVLVGFKYDFRFLWWNGIYKVEAEALGRNEPF